MSEIRGWGLALGLAVCVLPLAPAAAENRAGTPEARGRLFDELVRLTLEREAFSPVKNERLGLDFERQALALRDAFVAADTEAGLLHALTRLSNLRRDGHLSVEPVEGGLRYPDEDWRQAPLRFAVDYGTPGDWFLFVSHVAPQIVQRGASPPFPPRIGDRLLSINGLPVERLLERMQPYIASSTRERLWLELAVNASVRRVDFGPELYQDEVSYELLRPTGERFKATLPYLDPGQLQWSGAPVERPFTGVPHESPQAFTKAGWALRKHYPEFREVLETPSYRLHLPVNPERRVVVVDWRRFHDKTYVKDVDRLMELAVEEGLLDHGVICDLTTSRGGKLGWYLLQRLASRPFEVTRGNLRLSDITPRLVARLSDRDDDDDGDDSSDARLLDWLRTDVAGAIEAGRSYTRPVPFKLRALPRSSDAVLGPAQVHFRGRLVAIFGPLGRSQVDQWAAMFIDNGLGHSIGMATGGSSNTWEWKEVLRWDDGTPIARFAWSVGHTLRPNGEVLEGNPARPLEPMPVTRDNFASYSEEALARALRHLGATEYGERPR